MYKSIVGAIAWAEDIFKDSSQYIDVEKRADRLTYNVHRFPDGTFQILSPGFKPTEFWTAERRKEFEDSVIVATLYAWNGTVL